MGVSYKIIEKIANDKRLSIKQLSDILGWPYPRIYRRMNDAVIKSDELLYMIHALGYELYAQNDCGEEIVNTEKAISETQFDGYTVQVISDLFDSGKYKKIDIARASKSTLNHLLHKIERNSFAADEFIALLSALGYQVSIVDNETGEVIFQSEKEKSFREDAQRGTASEILRKSIISMNTTQTHTAGFVGLKLGCLNQKLRKNSLKADEFIEMLLKIGVSISIEKNDSEVISVDGVFKYGEFASNEIICRLLEIEKRSKASLCALMSLDTNQLNQKMRTRTIRADEFINIIEYLGMKVSFYVGKTGDRIV